MGNPGRQNALPPGMVYTDPEGRIVYANRQFLELLSISPARSPVSMTLEEVLHVEPGAVRDFCAERERNQQRQLALLYQQTDSTQATALMTSVPAYDQRHKFVGMNIGVEVLAGAQAPPNVPVIVATAHALPARQPEQGHKAAPDPGMNGRFLEVVLNTFQAMLARMAGPRVRESFVTALAQLARRNNWPVYGEDHQLVLDQADLPADICARLISEGLDFSVAVVGQRVIVYEIEELYAQLDPVLQEHALQTGLSLPLLKGLAT